MIRGRYGDTTKRPYVEGRLSIPSLKLNGDISFCFDTGADSMLLTPMDAQKLGVDYSTLASHTTMNGVGGAGPAFLEKGLVTFRGTDGTLYVYEIQITIAAPNPQIATVPSLLGRDVINCWHVNYHPEADILECHPLRASKVFKPPPLTPKGPLPRKGRNRFL